MFFIMGFGSKSRQLEYAYTMICRVCGKYGRYEIQMTYEYFSFFFIPILKWKKEFYVRTTCCGSVYKLSPEIGKRIARGEEAEIQEQDLELLEAGRTAESCSMQKICPSCGYAADADFQFCPKCGASI